MSGDTLCYFYSFWKADFFSHFLPPPPRGEMFKCGIHLCRTDAAPLRLTEWIRHTVFIYQLCTQRTDPSSPSHTRTSLLFPSSLICLPLSSLLLMSSSSFSREGFVYSGEWATEALHHGESLQPGAGGLRAANAPHAVEVGLPASPLQSGHEHVPGPQHLWYDAATWHIRVWRAPPYAVVALQWKHAVWCVPVEGGSDWTSGGGKEKHLPWVEKVQHPQRRALLVSIWR